LSRQPVTVRDASARDAAALSSLWGELLVRPGSDAAGLTSEISVAQAVARQGEGSDMRILVADAEGEVAGCVFLRVGVVSPVHDDHAVHVSHLQVDSRFSRQEVGTGLLEAALTWAEQKGIGTLLAATGGNDRETNRFMARLGLGQVAVLRGSSVAALRARLPHDPKTGLRGASRNGRNVGQVVAMRRSQRRARNRDVAL
jgi:GNAT superfamily N-acetyltransferase